MEEAAFRHGHFEAGRPGAVLPGHLDQDFGSGRRTVGQAEPVAHQELTIEAGGDGVIGNGADPQLRRWGAPAGLPADACRHRRPAGQAVAEGEQPAASFQV
jgi:hypothetical protein